jgi:hypothetical protein
LKGALINDRNQIAIYLKENGARLKVEYFSENIEVNHDKIEKLFATFEENGGDKDKKTIHISKFNKYLKNNGLDIKINKTLAQLIKEITQDDNIHFDSLVKIAFGEPNCLQKCLTGTLVIRNWSKFIQDIKETYEEVNNEYEKLDENKKGKNASYIPGTKYYKLQSFLMLIQLFLVLGYLIINYSFTTIDGQTFDIGDTEEIFPIQSCGKSIQYSYSVENHGYEFIHEHVGKEPSVNFY